MYGIVLEGGGAKGAYQIGAWKALRELGIEFNGVVGTSIGTINAALMIQDDFEAACDLWSKVDIFASDSMGNEIYSQLATYKFTSKDPMKIKKEIKEAFGIEGMDISSLRRYVNSMVKEDIIRKASKDFGLVTISMKKRRGLRLFKEDIPQGQLGDYIVASCYFPIYKTIEMNGDFFLDGSYYDRLPTKMLIDKGYKNIIEIRLYPPKQDEEKQIYDSNVNVITIYPKEYLGKTMDFNKKTVIRNMKLGYSDAYKVFKDIKDI